MYKEKKAEYKTKKAKKGPNLTDYTNNERQDLNVPLK